MFYTISNTIKSGKRQLELCTAAKPQPLFRAAVRAHWPASVPPPPSRTRSTVQLSRQLRFRMASCSSRLLQGRAWRRAAEHERYVAPYSLSVGTAAPAWYIPCCQPPRRRSALPGLLDAVALWPQLLLRKLHGVLGAEHAWGREGGEGGGGGGGGEPRLAKQGSAAGRAAGAPPSSAPLPHPRSRHRPAAGRRLGA